MAAFFYTQFMMSSNPIGIFDSGIGGISIMREIVALLPSEPIIYLADSKNAPYGERSREEIIQLCEKNVDFLLKHNCKLIVVACNTATTNAIKYLREKYAVPFVGIEPAIKPAALNSTTRKIGVLATKGTLSSELFHETVLKYASQSQIIEVIGSGLVERIEAGDFDSEELLHLLRKYLVPLIEKNIDYLVLGCSHYPFLTPLLREILPSSVSIIDSGLAVAKQTKTLLLNYNLTNQSEVALPSLTFYTNSVQNTLKIVLERYFKAFKLVKNYF